MSLKTPEKIERLQRKLCEKAKKEPAFRFYQLYDKVYREDILEFAYRSARTNKGAPGVDGLTFALVSAAATSKARGWGSGWPGCGRSCTPRRTNPVRCGG